VRSLVLSSLVVAALLTPRGASRADDNAARRAAVLVHAGATLITVGDLEDRLAKIPAVQLETFGTDGPTIRRRFLNEVMIPDLLLASGAKSRGLDTKLPTSNDIDRTRASATKRAVRDQVGPASAIAIDDVKSYYDDNRARFDAPDRLSLWRILCKTKEEAQTVLDAAKKDPTPKAFEALARDHSIDKASYLRGGNLGFVGPDGSSNEAGLRVDAAVPKAAASVKDGQFVAEPIAEGDNFAVIWRRGTIAASKRSLDDAAPQIRDTIWKERVEAAQKKLLEDLRAKNVRDVNEDLLQGLNVAFDDKSLGPRRRPGQVPPIGQPAPSPK
jgi:peptidyl-prolyl cis-trans isomerase C